MELESKIRELAMEAGVSFFGVADLAPARDAILEQGGDIIASFPRAVSLGIRLVDSLVDQLPRTDSCIPQTYKHYYGITVNQRLDHIASRLGGVLEQEGYRALPVPAAQPVDSERVCAAFSHKMAARLAGLGWIGKNCLLITPKAGPRMRWITILTDAPLPLTGEPIEQRCDTCRKCVDICPVGALTGEPFRLEDHRDVRLRVRECQKHLEAMEKKVGASACGLCMYVCPYGNNHTSQNK